MTQSSSGEHIGPLGEEAMKLIGAAQQWLHRGVSDPSTARIATGTPECAWCPICQLLAMVRGDGPAEGTAAVLAERFSEVQSAVAGLLRALAESMGGAAGTPGQSPTPRVQRIDLGNRD
ncbi:MAG: hypothetical protein QOK10_3300 [Pseudonocardiales bacterium]|jgi:hypothetical protein|nr:hypothetical protein [Pseudonocardiales bacterium]